MRPVLSFDTSALNRLLKSPGGQALASGCKAGYHLRLTATSMEEIFATENAGLRDRLLDLCQSLRNGESAEVILPFHVIVERLVVAFEGDNGFDWQRVPVRAPEYEQELVRREFVSDSLAAEERQHGRAVKELFERTYSNARPHFDALFARGIQRPNSSAELVRHLQGGGGAYWSFAIGLFERAAGRAPDEATVQAFESVCPPFRALLMALCVAQYDRCILETATANPADRTDLFAAAYLPYCDQFISDDRDQQRCLRDVTQLAGLSTAVRWFDEFANSFVPAAVAENATRGQQSSLTEEQHG